MGVLVLILALACVASVTAAEPPRDLNLDTSSTSALDTTRSSELWAISIPTDGALSIEASAASSLNITLRFYDVDGTRELDSNTGGYETSRKVGREDLEPGRYFVKIASDGSKNTGSYTISARFVPQILANDPEPNDSAEDALPAGPGIYTGHLGYYGSGSTDKEDWYTIETNQDGDLSFVFRADEGFNIAVRLYAANASTQVDNDTGGYKNQRSIRRKDLAASRYYLKIYADGNVHGGYRMEVAYKPATGRNDPEPNDSAATAVSIAPGTAVYGHLGYVLGSKADTVDWFSVDMQEAGTYSLFCAGEPSLNITLGLFRKDGKAVDEDRGGYSSSRVLKNMELDPGLYRIRIEQDGAGYGSYAFILGRPGIESAPPLVVPQVIPIAQTPGMQMPPIPPPLPPTTLPPIPANPPDVPGISIAVGLDAFQSSGEGGAQGGASGGVDGVKNGKSGFRTATEENPWWLLDLGSIRFLGGLRIYNSIHDQPEDVQGLRIMISDDCVYWKTVYRHTGAAFGGVDGRPLSLWLSGERARFLRLDLPGRSSLHLDEVEVLESPGSGGGGR
jgi:hypothetical protein